MAAQLCLCEYCMTPVRRVLAALVIHAAAQPVTPPDAAAITVRLVFAQVQQLLETCCKGKSQPEFQSSRPLRQTACGDTNTSPPIPAGCRLADVATSSFQLLLPSLLATGQTPDATHTGS